MKKIYPFAMNVLPKVLALGLSLSIPLAFADDQSSLLAAQQNAIAGKVAPAQFNPNSRMPIIIPTAPDIDARGFVLMDANSGQILAQKNMNQRMPPASLTKLMTMFVISRAMAQHQVNLTDNVRISENAWHADGSRMFLKVGTSVPLQTLVDGIIVASGNDACVAAAEYIAGTEDSFASLMNQTAAQLGMTGTHYMDSTGLPNPNHYSTPYDLAILSRHIINDFPQDYAWYKQKWIVYNNIRQPNRNRLLWRDPTVDGLKTGHTGEAGFCLVSSAVRDKNMRLITVVMGAPTDEARANDSQALLNWGFRFYQNKQLFEANTPIANPRVWSGTNRTIPLGLSRALSVSIPRGIDASHIDASMNLPQKLVAPIVKGQVYGQVEVKVDGKLIASAPLIALENDARTGFFGRASDRIALFFKSST